MKAIVKMSKRQARVNNYVKNITGKFFVIGDCYKGRWWNATNLKEVRRLSKLAFLLLFITSCSSVDTTSKEDYWKQRCLAAENVINQVEEDCEDYVLDVLCEGDNWELWREYCIK